MLPFIHTKNKRQMVFSLFTPTQRHFINILCNRLKVAGLPEEIDKHFFLYQLLLYGRVLFFKKNDKYHVYWFSGRGKFTEYHIWNKFLVVNPWFSPDGNNTETMEFDESNSVIVFSDITAYVENSDCGLADLIYKYSGIIDNIDKSVEVLVKNSKLIAFLTGNTRSFVESARRAIDKCFKGDEAIAIMEESLVDSIKVNPVADKTDYKLSELIKARQYYISDFYQKIGVASNQNMKKERLTDNESQLVESVADVDFNHIVDYINESLEKVNKLFELSIRVELNGDNEEEKEEKEEEKEEEEEVKEEDNEKEEVEEKGGE